MSYEPEYAKGEILIYFKDSCCGGVFVQTFMQTLRYNYDIDKNKRHNHEWHIVDVPNGEEQETIEKLNGKYPLFIDWMDRRDLKLEKRWKNLEGIINSVNKLNEEASKLSQQDYNSKIDKVKQNLEKIKESK